MMNKIRQILSNFFRKKVLNDDELKSLSIDAWSFLLSDRFVHRIDDDGQEVFMTDSRFITVYNYKHNAVRKEELLKDYMDASNNLAKKAIKHYDPIYQEDYIRYGFVFVRKLERRHYRVVKTFSIVDNGVLEMTFYNRNQNELKWYDEILKTVKHRDTSLNEIFDNYTIPSLLVE